MTEPLAPAASAPVPAAEAAGIHKQFGSTQALRGVDLTLWPGRCLGLVGRNGAGKSTLVSILSGIYPADSGQVRFDGAAAPPLGAVGAWRSRIATVFQHSMVVPGLTVAENVFLGRQPRRGGLVDWGRMREQARQVMTEWGFPIDVRLPCADLTVEQRQIVEIARALAAGTRCLLLDEPTAALERGGIERLFARVRQLAASGVAVLYISHHLEEVFEICQDIAVIRDGELVLTGAAAELTKDRLVAAMVGPHVAGPGAGAAGRGRPRPVPGRAGPRFSARRSQTAAGRWLSAACAPAPDRRTAPGRPPGRAWWSSRYPRKRPAATCTTCRWRCSRASGSVLPALLGAGVGTLARIVAGAAPCDCGPDPGGGPPAHPGPARSRAAGRGRLHPGGPPGRTAMSRCSAWPRTPP